MDIGANLLRRWHRQLEEEASGARLSMDEREELQRLRQAVRSLRLETEILKKVSQYCAKEMQCSTVRIHRQACRPLPGDDAVPCTGGSA